MKKSKMNKGEVKSPRTKKCCLDRNKICTGCFRSIDEIILWRDAEELARRKIVEAAKLRHRPGFS